MGSGDSKPLPDRALSLKDFVGNYDKWLVELNNEFSKDVAKDAASSAITDASLLAAVKSILSAQKKLKEQEAQLEQLPLAATSSKAEADAKADSDALAAKWAFTAYSQLRESIMNAARYARDEKRVSVEDILHEFTGKEAKMGEQRSVVDLNDSRLKCSPVELLLVDSRLAWIDGNKFWYNDPVHGKLDFPSLESMLLPFHKRVHLQLAKQAQQLTQLTEEQGYPVLAERLVLLALKASPTSKRIVAVSVMLYSGEGDMIAGAMRYVAKEKDSSSSK